MNAKTTKVALGFLRANFPEEQLQSPGDVNDFFDEQGITIESVLDDLEDVERWVNDDIDKGATDSEFSGLGIPLIDLAAALKDTNDSVDVDDDEIFDVVELFVDSCTPFMEDNADIWPLLRSVFFGLFMSPGDAHVDGSDGSVDEEGNYSDESAGRMQTGSGGARKVAYPLALGMIVVALSFLQG